MLFPDALHWQPAFMDEKYNVTSPRVLNKLRKSWEEKLPAG